MEEGYEEEKTTPLPISGWVGDNLLMISNNMLLWIGQGVECGSGTVHCDTVYYNVGLNIKGLDENNMSSSIDIMVYKKDRVAYVLKVKQEVSNSKRRVVSMAHT